MKSNEQSAPAISVGDVDADATVGDVKVNINPSVSANGSALFAHNPKKDHSTETVDRSKHIGNITCQKGGRQNFGPIASEETTVYCSIS